MKRIKTPSIVQPNRRKLLLLVLILALLSWLGWQIFEHGRMQGGFDSEQAEQKAQQCMQQVNEEQQVAAEFRAQWPGTSAKPRSSMKRDGGYSWS